MTPRFLLALVALWIFEPASCAQHEAVAEYTTVREHHPHLQIRTAQPGPEGICNAYLNPKEEWGHAWGEVRQRYLTNVVLKVPISLLNVGEFLRFCREGILNTLAAECRAAGKGMWWGPGPFFEGFSLQSPEDNKLGPRGYCVIAFDFTEAEPSHDYRCIEETLRCMEKPVKCVSTILLEINLGGGFE